MLSSWIRHCDDTHKWLLGSCVKLGKIAPAVWWLRFSSKPRAVAEMGRLIFRACQCEMELDCIIVGKLLLVLVTKYMKSTKELCIYIFFSNHTKCCTQLNRRVEKTKQTHIKHTAKMKWYKKNNQTKICTQTIQNGVTKKCSIHKKKHNRHQHNTDDGGQAMGEEMRHVQMSR